MDVNKINVHVIQIAACFTMGTQKQKVPVNVISHHLTLIEKLMPNCYGQVNEILHLLLSLGVQGQRLCPWKSPYFEF